MNVIKTIAVLLAMLIVSNQESQAALMGKIRVKGSNIIAMKSVVLDLEGVTKLEVSRAIDVDIVESTPNGEIIVNANDNLIDYLVVEVVGNALNITVDSKIKSFSKAKLSVVVPYNGEFSSFDATSAANIVSLLPMRMEQLEIKASSAADVSLTTIVDGDCTVRATSSAEVVLVAKVVGDCTVEASSASELEIAISANELSIETSSAAEVEIAGNVERFVARASSASQVDARELVVQKGQLRASSSGAIIYNDLGDFMVSSSSAGSIRSVTN